MNEKDKNISTNLEKAIIKCEQIEATFSAFSKELKAEGTISSKEKTLISLAIGVVKGCEWCVRNHVSAALEQGITGEQIIEAAGMAVQMDGGPAWIRMRQFALKAIEDYENGYRAERVGTEWKLVKKA